MRFIVILFLFMLNGKERLFSKPKIDWQEKGVQLFLSSKENANEKLARLELAKQFSHQCNYETWQAYLNCYRFVVEWEEMGEPGEDIIRFRKDLDSAFDRMLSLQTQSHLLEESLKESTLSNPQRIAVRARLDQLDYIYSH